jgi:hypothetical protein
MLDRSALKPSIRVGSSLAVYMLRQAEAVFDLHSF